MQHAANRAEQCIGQSMPRINIGWLFPFCDANNVCICKCTSALASWAGGDVHFSALFGVCS